MRATKLTWLYCSLLFKLHRTVLSDSLRNVFGFQPGLGVGFPVWVSKLSRSGQSLLPSCYLALQCRLMLTFQFEFSVKLREGERWGGRGLCIHEYIELFSIPYCSALYCLIWLTVLHCSHSFTLKTCVATSGHVEVTAVLFEFRSLVHWSGYRFNSYDSADLGRRVV